MCPAAGTNCPLPTGRWLPPRRAGACPRRCAALPTTTGVGVGILDGPGWGAVWARQGCRALRWGDQKGRRLPPAWGWGRRPCGIATGVAPSADGALGRLGFSPAAAGDQRLCLWKPRFFEKNRVKLSFFGLFTTAGRNGGHRDFSTASPGPYTAECREPDMQSTQRAAHRIRWPRRTP